MTVLRPEVDGPLHDEHGNHIDPGADRSLVGKLRRHLARHELLAPVQELAEAGRELADARRATAEAQARERLVRRRAAAVAKRHIDEGMSLAQAARALGINERTLRDYLEYGKAQRRNK